MYLCTLFEQDLDSQEMDVFIIVYVYCLNINEVIKIFWSRAGWKTYSE